MDCIGLQALSDSSESDIEESFMRIDHDPNSHENMDSEFDNQQEMEVAGSKLPERSTQEKREFLYDQYKDGLKTLMTGDYLEAEKSFENLLAHSYLEQFATDKWDESDLDESDKALVQLKYILYKNLASISTKHTQDLSKALNFLIQAAKIDASDICLWFEIGQTSLQLDRFLIAKLAFEQSLHLDPAYWPSLDNFIVLVYALGNYTLCLRYVFSALKLDKFYMNGIILLKKMALSDEAMYTQQIELFVDANYDTCGIDLDALLANSPESFYDELFDRIDSITSKLYLKRMEQVGGRVANEGGKKKPGPLVFYGKEVGTWKALGEYLVDMNHIWWTSEWNAQTPVEVKVLESEVLVVAKDKAANVIDADKEKDKDVTEETNEEDKKLDEVKVIVATNSSARSLKRKKTDTQSSSDDSWWKRRSARKGSDKNSEAEAELTVQHILKKFFDETQLSESNQTTAGNNKNNDKGSSNADGNKKTLNESLVEYSVPELKDSEAKVVKKVLAGFGSNSQSIHRVCRAYLERLAENFDRIWPAGLDETYMRLFSIVNGQYDLWEAITSETEPSELLRLCSILLVYLEVEFSRFKDTVERYNQKRQLSVASIERINGRHILRLVNQLQWLETYLEAAGLLNRNDALFLPTRLAAIGLYASLSTTPGTLSTAYYVDQIGRLLGRDEGTEARVFVANSRIMAVISQQSVTDLLKLNDKSQILNQASSIRDMFDANKFQEVHDLVGEFAENHWLSLKDAKFDPSIYVYFLRSCLSLNQLDECGYFCHKFLKQIVKHFRAQLSNKSSTNSDQQQQSTSRAASLHSLDTNDASTNQSNASNETIGSCERTRQPNNTAQILHLLGTVLDLLHEVFQAKRRVEAQTGNENSTQGFSHQSTSCDSPAFLGFQDLVWLMFQLLLMFFENHYANLKYFQVAYRPLKAFSILFECMAASGVNSKSERVQYLSLVHQYLAKSSLCMHNAGEFLVWSTDTLMAYLEKCEICNQQEAEDQEQEQIDKDIDVIESAEQTATENSNNETESNNNPIGDSSKTSKLKQQQKKSTKANATAAVDEAGCETCDDCSDLLEQNLACLYGYRKPRARYLETHSVARHLDYTLENCVHVYEHFKLSELPEYDDVAKWSVSSEFNEFLLQVVLPLLGIEDETLVQLQENFLQGLETEQHEEVAELVKGLRGCDVRSEEMGRFRDMYFMLGDYALKTEKDFERKKSLVLKFLSKDITLNSERYDSWAALALLQSSIVLEEYLERGFNLSDQGQVEDFLRQVYVTVNLFRCSTDLMPKDQKIWVEYGSFLYQIHSYCSRQLKLDLMVKHFSEPSIRARLEAKRIEFLELALEAYTTVNSGGKIQLGVAETVSETAEEDTNSKQTTAEETSQSYSQNNGPQKARSIAMRRKSDKEADAEDDEKEDDTEKWLFHYMLGKIQEKMGVQMASLMKSLEHYKHSIRYLETVNKATFLKKMTHKTKGNFSFESNEIYYRIYGLTLKRLERVSRESSSEEMSALLSLLEAAMDTKFVKCHGDLQLDEVSLFVSELVTQRSQAIASVPNSDTFFRILCICVAGLMQLLKRYPQHYRSQHRLAHFYASFLDLDCADMAKHVLLGVANWAQLPHMSAPGLLHERTKSNFFGGVHAIRDQDLERGGSYENHMFQIVKLLVELLQKTGDLANMLEVSRGLYVKSDTERQYLEDSQRIYFANLSLETAWNILMENATSTLSSQGEAEMELTELMPILLDTYELYKLYAKHYETQMAKVDFLLTEIYLRFQPDRRNMVTNEELMRFCRAAEAKDKAEKAVRNKPSKPANRLQQQHQQAHCLQSLPIILD